MRVVVPVLLMVAAGLAGCADAPAAVVPTEEPQPTESTGSIAGSVTTDEGLPVAAAEVAILELQRSTSTDKEGAFVFNNLSAGSFGLVVQKLGFESRAVKADVRAGEVSALELVLLPIEIGVEPFADVLTFDGYIHCGVNPYYPSNVCGDTLGEDTARFVFEVSTTYELHEVVVELAWQAGTAGTGQHLELDLCDEVPLEDDTLLCFEGDYWEWTSGRSPLIMREDNLPVDEYLRYQVTVGAGFPDEGDPLSLGPALQQPFTIFISLCYVEECAQDYTAMPPV